MSRLGVGGPKFVPVIFYSSSQTLSVPQRHLESFHKIQITSPAPEILI